MLTDVKMAELDRYTMEEAYKERKMMRRQRNESRNNASRNNKRESYSVSDNSNNVSGESKSKSKSEDQSNSNNVPNVGSNVDERMKQLTQFPSKHCPSLQKKLRNVTQASKQRKKPPTAKAIDSHTLHNKQLGRGCRGY